MTAWRWLSSGPIDPDYAPIKVREVQIRLLTEDIHRWLFIVSPGWRDPSYVHPHGRHRRWR